MTTNRREFLTAAALSHTVLGANDRINLGIVGTGGRFGLLDAAFLAHADARIAALCDVNRNRLDAYQSKKLKDQPVASFTDYRRLLDRKDIDAIVICTPDHQHAPIMIAALQAGKDVYCEKPATNTIEAGVAMLKAYRAHNRVVQLGTQQRSWKHFRDAAQLIWDGYLGDVTHVVVAHNAGGGMGGNAAPRAPEPVPEGLDWDAFLGPARKVPYDPRCYSNWRAWYDYGGGMITDWGVHWMDIVHLCMKSDREAASYTSSVSVPHADPEQVSTDWFITYQYPRYLMTFLGFVPPTSEPVAEGPTFYGSKGWLRVNRNGYIVRANRAPVRLAFTPAGRAAAGETVAPAPAPSRAAAPQPKPIDDITQVDPAQNVPGERGSEVVHVRDFLDCVKSRRKPVAEFETGFHATLPCLLGRLSVQQQRAYVWDPQSLTARPA